METLNIVFLGISITSSWGNGHATVYRGLIRELALRGHQILFLERDHTLHADSSDLTEPGYGQLEMYYSLADLKSRFATEIAEADCVIVGSYVQDGIEISKWVQSIAQGITAFYDLDTPITLAGVEAGKCSYMSLPVMQEFDLYLSFTGGPILARLENEFHVQCARPLYCAADLSTYYPRPVEKQFDLGYLGNYAQDRQATLNKLLVQPATLWPEGRFVVAGALFPPEIVWPQNVEHIAYLAPQQHRDFYNHQKFALNITREEMKLAGYSPSVRLFEAAGCGVPVITDYWEGIETFFQPAIEILVVEDTRDALQLLQRIPEEEAAAIGERARQRVIAEHTAAHRAVELELLIAEAKVAKTVLNCCKG